MGADRRKKRMRARIEVYDHGACHPSSSADHLEFIPSTQFHVSSSGAMKAQNSVVAIPSTLPITPSCDNTSLYPDNDEYIWDSTDILFEFDDGPSAADVDGGDATEVVTFDAPKRKRHQSRSTFLDEFIRLEGRGDNASGPFCACGCDQAARYRCKDCLSVWLRCQGCIISDHAHNPFHRIEVSFAFFEQITLKGLGLRVQLGHETGEHCMSPKAAPADDFVVIDCHGIHEIALDFCGCPSAQKRTTQLLRARLFPATVREPRTAATFPVLEQFHLLSFESKVSEYEFYHSLAQRMDNTGLTPLRDRYQAFMRMVREWRHLTMLKCAGRGHDPEGVDSTKIGQWLTTKFHAVDTNFRLRRDNTSSDTADPSLSNGWAFFVEEHAYKAYLAEYAQLPQEKSTCHGHVAVNMADTKSNRGLAATGVGAVDCARHNMKLPCGVGDLQKGEKYANMDYLIFSALTGYSGQSLFISYDIACQWHKHVWERMSTLPPRLHFDTENKNIVFAVPKFHLSAHIEICQTTFSFNFIKGGGRTDGEAIERGWSNFNPIASSTKAMGPGSQRDTLDDHFGDWNWKKTVSLGPMLVRKMKEAVIGGRGQHNALAELEGTLDAPNLSRYKAEMEAWEADRSKPNPFHSRVDAPTQSSIRLMLAQDEAKELENGNNVSLHTDVPPSVFIATGIDLEDQQRCLGDDLARLDLHATDLQKAKLQQRLNALQRKIELWTAVQLIYMPSVAALRARATPANSTEPQKIEPHKFKLWLPSELCRTDSCDIRLREYEWSLRHAQAHDTLNQIRQYLRLQSHLYHFKDRNIRGQGANTRARNVLKGVDAKVSAGAKKYQAARRALQTLSIFLGKVGWELELKELSTSDLKAMTDLVDGETEGRKKLTWIWRTPGVMDSEDEGLQDAVRMEWCKTRACAMRWSEEVELLQEEMWRVLAYFEWHAAWWKEKADARWVIDSELAEGLSVYSLCQASLRTALGGLCCELWTVNSEKHKVQETYSPLSAVVQKVGIGGKLTDQ
ncbi:hypothetical protein BV22DRAFT_1108120 [Leucogyrophana mollusca]|uniref:Uncharacterized protein n=1 Tax=Leucogyrophana mollusca TaxID=85980 RepID=A0ACB8B3J0_9AGAM|nr:hypothetical protein BV22DRAFT_1108120 [Leucogyrophana mollusca]